MASEPQDEVQLTLKYERWAQAIRRQDPQLHSIVRPLPPSLSLFNLDLQKNVEPIGRRQHIGADRLQKSRIKQRINVKEEEYAIIDDPFHVSRRCHSYLSDRERFSGKSFAEIDRLEREKEMKKKKLIEQRARQRRFEEERSRYRKMEDEQFEKLAAFIKKPSPTASSVPFNIVNHVRAPGIYGEMFMYEEKKHRQGLAGRRGLNTHRSKAPWDLLTGSQNER